MSSFKRFLLTILLTLMWSPSFLFIKFALEDFPPITIAALRVSIAAIVMSLILLCKWRAIPLDKGFWIRMGIMAFFSSVAPFALFCYAEQTIESALAAIINGTTPIFTAIMAQFFVVSDRITPQKAIGITLGTLGVILLFAPKLMLGVTGTSIGMLAALMAALSYAISHIFGKKFTSGHQAFVAPTAQMILSALFLWPFAIWNENFFNLNTPSISGIGGVCGLALFGTIFAFIIYYKLLDYCGPTAISMVACFFPVVGMFLGFVFLGETFTSWGLLASGMIVLGMLLVNEVVVIDFLKFKKTASENSQI